MNAQAQDIDLQPDLKELLDVGKGYVRIAIVGLGRTGLSAAKFLAKHGVDFTVTDSRVNPPGLSELTDSLPEVSTSLGGFDPEMLVDATHLLVSPGVPLETPEIAQTLECGATLISDIDIFGLLTTAPVVAITGANGKSTVTTLVGLMAEKAGKKVRIGGNLGVPALDLLGDHEPDLYVLELSSFQLERTSLLRAAAATVLNISPDHMDRHQDLKVYAQQKQRIFNGDGIMILNEDDPIVRNMAQRHRRCLFFGLDSIQSEYHYCPSKAGNWLVANNIRLMSMDNLKLRGTHNISNALAALALGDSVGLSVEGMKQALCEFEGLDHRMQFVTEINGVDWINDSKATNVGACFAALDGLAGPIILIAGGDGKGADFSELGPIVQQKVRAAILIGRDTDLLWATFTGKTQVVKSTTIAEAVIAAKDLANPGDTVLLSPACASLDQFSSYRERGEKFVDAVLGGRQ